MALSTKVKEAIVHLWLLASLPQPFQYKSARETEARILLGTQNTFHLCHSDLSYGQLHYIPSSKIS